MIVQNFAVTRTSLTPNKGRGFLHHFWHKLGILCAVEYVQNGARLVPKCNTWILSC